MLLSLLACTEPEPRESRASDDSAVQESRADSPEDSPTESPADSPEDSSEDSPVDTAPTSWRSALYPEDWTPEFTAEDGHFLHDFSYAGYHAGEAPLPTLGAGGFDVTAYGADKSGASDSTSAIRAAISAASAAASAGAHTVVHFPAGSYRVDDTLTVSTSNVVLRGEGSGSTRLYFTRTSGMDYSAHLTFAGNPKRGADHPLTADGEARSHTVRLSSTEGVAVGDEVELGFTISEAFVAEHGMTGVWTEFNGDWKTFFRRTVTAVDPSTGTVTLDVPLRAALKVRDGASLRVQTGAISEVGIEGMSLSNAADWDTAWATTQVHLLLFSGVRDAWARGLASFESTWPSDGQGKHLISSGVEVLDSRRVTISGVTMEQAAHRGDGGNGYLFEISRSNEILTVDSTARAGRHNFIQNWDFGTSGCVWLRTTSEDGRAFLADWDPWGYIAYSEFHHSLAMANLIDESVATDGWQGVNRQKESSGAGHSATENVFWNLSGSGYLRSLQYGDGYVIGPTGMDVHVDPSEWDWNDSGEGTEPEDWREEQDLPLEPSSLYEDQLARRLAGG